MPCRARRQAPRLEVRRDITEIVTLCYVLQERDASAVAWRLVETMSPKAFLFQRDVSNRSATAGAALANLE
jgi:hypothetical protein